MSTDKNAFTPKTFHYESYESAVKNNPILKVQIEQSGKFVYMFKDEFYYTGDRGNIGLRYYTHKDLDRFAVLVVWKSKTDYFFSSEFNSIFDFSSNKNIYSVHRSAQAALEILNDCSAEFSKSYPIWREVTDMEKHSKAVKAKFC